MTYAEIKAMKQEIAAKVMGYTKANYGDGSGEYWQDSDEKWMCWVGSEPEWPTDIKAAWQVMDKLTARTEIALASSLNTWCVYEAGCHDALDYPHIASDASAPMAICLAALKIYGGH